MFAQRPFGQRVANIGTWQNALSVLGYLAVIVNCALIGMSGQVSRLWPGLTSTQTILCIVVLEHIMLGLRSAMTHLLPDMPSWLATEIARAEHIRREILTKESSVNSRSSTPFNTSLRNLLTDRQPTSSPPETATDSDALIFHHIAPLEKPLPKYVQVDGQQVDDKTDVASSSKPSSLQVETSKFFIF